jgi:hypothetical protein
MCGDCIHLPSHFITYSLSRLSKIAVSGGKVQIAFRSEARNARPGASRWRAPHMGAQPPPSGGRFAPCHPLPLRWAPFASGEPPRSPAPLRLRRSRRPKGGRPGAVGPDARKASPQRRGVLDVRRRRRRAKPDKADGPTPPALPRRGGQATVLSYEL